ncbi:Tubulin gamma chain [Entamoeba marina]
MPREIVTLNVGQCGNQLGSSFFKKISTEHGILPDGSLKTTEFLNDRKDVFFYQADDQRYVPRSVNIDLEPRVLDSIRSGEWKHFFNPENLIIPTNNGAGNSWANGYFTEERLTDIEDVIDREAEHCDSLEGFFFMSLNKWWNWFRTNPDVVVSPYNSVLTLKRLVTECQSVIVYDNATLADIAHSQYGVDEATVSDMNAIICESMSAFTASIRFPATLYSGLNATLLHLAPSRFAHFLVASYTPLRLVERVAGRTIAIDVMKRLLQPQNLMARIKLKEGCFVSMCDFFQGDVSADEINEALQRFTDRRLVDFVPWNKDSLKIVNTRVSPIVKRGSRISGLMLANHTSVRHYFEDILKSFNQMYKKGVYLESYQSKDIVKCVIDEYEKAESTDFLNYKYPIHDHLHGIALSKRMR